MVILPIFWMIFTRFFWNIRLSRTIVVKIDPPRHAGCRLAKAKRGEHFLHRNELGLYKTKHCEDSGV